MSHSYNIGRYVEAWSFPYITLSWMADSYLVIVWDQNLVVGIDFYMIIDNHCAFSYKKIIWGRIDLKVILI